MTFVTGFLSQCTSTAQRNPSKTPHVHFPGTQWQRWRSNAFGGEKGLTNRSANGAHTRRRRPHKREVILTVRGFTPGGSGYGVDGGDCYQRTKNPTMGEFDFIPACVAIAKPEGRLGPSCRGPAVTGEQGNAS
jgi:hypothetical protein